MRGIHRWPVNSPHKWPVTRKNVPIWWRHHNNFSHSWDTTDLWNMTWWCSLWERYPYSWGRHQMETFSRYWPFVRGIHRSPVNSPHKGQWRGAFMFSMICAWINRWVNNRETGDFETLPRPLWRHCNATPDNPILEVNYPQHFDLCFAGLYGHPMRIGLMKINMSLLLWHCKPENWKSFHWFIWGLVCQKQV